MIHMDIARNGAGVCVRMCVCASHRQVSASIHISELEGKTAAAATLHSDKYV